ncbi:MAG: hypothetical protein M3462_11405, partial [Chloroflexota bacterium]|nr:hypothetical protein [Chloroflexota bacterium]
VFAIATSHGLKVFVITDYLFYNDAIERHLDDGAIGPAEFFRETIRAAFDAWPELDGLILRIGESDGVDVHGDFTSRLSIRRPSEARALLDTLLPLFEARDKTLVFRTWSLGAYPIGDLIWNPRTYDAVFGDIASPNLVVSMKYGDADFVRFVGLNSLFFHGPQRKLIELQCRREYEGMGEYPSFVGWLYAGYLAELRDGGSDLAGIWALQGGGWAPFQRLAFYANASIWNELNADVAVNLLTGTSTVEEIVSRFCDRYRIAAAGDFLTLLAMSDTAIEDGPYIRELARESAYFPRVRVPPLVWVIWNNVTSSGLVGSLSRHQVRDRATAVAEGHRAVETVEDMLRLSTDRGLPADGIRFQLDTFRILALMREVLLGTDTSDTHARLAALLPPYRQAYPVGYRFDDPIHGTNERDRPLRWLFGLLLRRQPRYRRRDRLLLSRGATGLNRYLVRRQRAALPRFVDTRGMASDTLLT